MPLRKEKPVIKCDPSDPAPITNPKYWDCKCDEKYIHTGRAKKCKLCGALRSEMPDSRQIEIDAGIHFAKERKTCLT